MVTVIISSWTKQQHKRNFNYTMELEDFNDTLSLAKKKNCGM